MSNVVRENNITCGVYENGMASPAIPCIPNSKGGEFCIIIVHDICMNEACTSSGFTCAPHVASRPNDKPPSRTRAANRPTRILKTHDGRHQL